MENRSKNPQRVLSFSGTVGALVVLLILSCANRYMVRDDHGRLISPLQQSLAFGGTPFERSLFASYDDLYDVEKIRYYIMLDLLEGLAERDGPNTTTYDLLQEVSDLHVIDDSLRVQRIFQEGLLELDRYRDGPEGSYFLEIELRRRAEQIRQCGCFLPESERYFDELGMLVARLGVYDILSFGESSMVVEFPNGIHASVDLDQNYEHRISSASFSLDRVLMKRDLENLRAQAGEMGGSESSESFLAAFLRDSSQLKIDEMDAYGTVAIDSGYDEIPVDRINLHVIPTSYGDGRWNGKAAGAAEGPWRWSRAFLDFYLNLRDIARFSADGTFRVDLNIEYEILHLTDTGATRISRETLPLQHSADAMGKDGAISFRLCTLPFITEGASTEGDYQINLKVTDGKRTAVRKHTFGISDRMYRLFLVDTEGEQYAGIPKFARIPACRAGEKITVMVPVKNLPLRLSDSSYCGEVRFFLFRNDKIKEGEVWVGGPFGFVFDDTTNAGAPVVPADSLDSLSFPQPVEVITVREPFPDAYLTLSFKIPRRLPDGSPVRFGKYSLAAMISSGSGRIADAVMTDLQIR